MTHTLPGAGRVAAMMVGAIALANVAAAQSPDEQSAYIAMIYTSVGGLPPLPPSTDSLGRTGGSGFTLHGRLGHTSRSYGPTLNAYGVGVEIPAGRRFRLGGTLAYLSASCDDSWTGAASECAGDIMIGGTMRTTLASKPLDGPPPSPRPKRGARPPANENSLVVGLDGSIGFSPRQGEQALAIAGGVPTAIVLKRGNLKILPFLTPGLGYGRLGNVSFFEERPTAHGKIAFMLGGGIGLEFGESGMGASAGFQRVFKSSGGATQIGLGMTWNGATNSRR